ncbi:glycoside hydrolase family 36 protein [uncultured Tessaracoccus sp.]|uniref:glycoside hydrolase family 36 protein n=1 Tax=uncultured Tessaracoccus sp. TaxID=905023 RepID=UPI0025D0FA96|nr:glycoside hydrolase family 36 protein [uncultured Tessaracoccus sp.]
MPKQAVIALTEEASLHLDGGSAPQVFLGGVPASSTVLPVECFTLERGRAFVDHRLTQSAQGAGFRLAHEGVRDDVDPRTGARRVEVPLVDPANDVRARLVVVAPAGCRALRVHTEIDNAGAAPVHLTAVSALSATVLPQAHTSDVDVLVGRSGWMSEGRWRREALDEMLVDITSELHGESPRDCLRLSAESAWSSGRWVPAGVVEDRRTGRSVAWQVEHNGGWTVELSRRTDRVGLALFGPTDLQHHWMDALAPGERFVTPTVAVAIGDEGWQDAVGELTTYRRWLRSVCTGRVEPAPIVFNDYLNTVMADPTSAKLRPLIRAAAEAGLETFCIDAGWFVDELDGDWWGGVGAWQPSRTRFDGGVEGILREIRDHGMTPGLWLEPLAVGLDSPAVGELRGAAMARGGVPLVEQGRLRLDMRSPLARRHLDEVVDRMVGYGIGYLKIDDNFSAGSGPDADADSPGAGLLGHCRAYRAWIASLTERHPGLVVENCGSGGMTADYAVLAHTDLQSTSDLQDMTKYPVIAASAPMGVLPEQCANWGVPEPDEPLGATVSTLVTSLTGSLYLSGHLDRLRDDQRALVREAVALAERERDALPTRLPRWPLGLPAWEDRWVTLVHVPPSDSEASDGLLFVWHRAGGAGEHASVTIPMAQDDLRWTLVEQCFPATADLDVTWQVEVEGSFVTCTVPASTTTARIFRIRRIHNRVGVDDAAPREEQ